MSGDRQAFDAVCGDCASVRVTDLTEADVREQSRRIDCQDEALIAAAVRGLLEYQEDAKSKET